MKAFIPENFLILIVDDINQNLQVIGSMLDQVGYATTFALSGQQALDRLTKTKPDMILLDLMMPDLNGLQVCRILKDDPTYKDIPIIFLTASQEHRHLLQAFEVGAVDYVTKPFNAPELLARVRTHLELKHTKDQLKESLMELEQIATTDPLTGVPNRRYLLAFAEKEISRARRYKCDLSLLIMDIDHFKQVNDTYGHAIGDDVLKLVAQTTVKGLRKEDCFGRFGGEEFVILLPHTETRFALEAAQRIRQTIADLSFTVAGKQLSISVSIGIASYQPSDCNLDALLKRADDALFEAKRRGRNRVLVHQDDVKNLLAS